MFYSTLTTNVLAANTPELLVELNHENIGQSKTILTSAKRLFDKFQIKMGISPDMEDEPLDSMNPLHEDVPAAGGTRKYRKNKKGTKKHKKMSMRKKNRPRKTRKR
jgi:hypothetical protein